MSQTQLDIGNVSHVAADAGVKLYSYCSLSISHTNPETSQYGRENALIDFSNTWVSRGIGLRVILELDLVEIEIKRSEWCQLVNRLGQTLQNAELWKQLCLKAELLTEPYPKDNNGSNAENIQLSLKYDDLVPFPKTGAYGADAVSFQRADPPKGIPVATVHEIRMKLCFSSLSKLNKKRTKTEHVENQEDNNMLFEPITYDNKKSDEEDLLDELDTQHSTSASTSIANSSQSQCGSSQTSVFSFMSSQPANQAGNGKRQLNVSDDDKVLYGPLLSEGLVTMLVDSAVRAFICRQRAPLPHGVAVSANNIRKGLSEIAPTLFNPGYSYAISERSKQIGIISRSLSSIFQRSQSRSLRESFTKLTLPDDGETPDTLNESDESPIPSQTMPIAIEQRLWLLAQTKLFDPKACRKLTKVCPAQSTGVREKDGKNVCTLAESELMDDPDRGDKEKDDIQMLWDFESGYNGLWAMEREEQMLDDVGDMQLDTDLFEQLDRHENGLGWEDV